MSREVFSRVSAFDELQRRSKESDHENEREREREREKKREREGHQSPYHEFKSSSFLTSFKESDKRRRRREREREKSVYLTYPRSVIGYDDIRLRLSKMYRFPMFRCHDASRTLRQVSSVMSRVIVLDRL